MPWNIIVCPDPLKNNENNCLGYICDWIENSWITIVCFITEKCFPLVIRLTLDIFKCYFPLCHWERLHWFVVRERCAVNMELISVCTRDLTILDSQDTWAGPPLRTQWIFCNEEASDLLGGGAGYAENALTVLWMHRWDVWYSYAGPSCLPHVLYSCAVEASKAEWALSKKSIFPGTMGSAGLQGAGTGRWMAEVADLPKTHCKSICVAKMLRAVRYI